MLIRIHGTALYQCSGSGIVETDPDTNFFFGDFQDDKFLLNFFSCCISYRRNIYSYISLERSSFSAFFVSAGTIPIYRRYLHLYDFKSRWQEAHWICLKHITLLVFKKPVPFLVYLCMLLPFFCCVADGAAVDNRRWFFWCREAFDWGKGWDHLWQLFHWVVQWGGQKDLRWGKLYLLCIRTGLPIIADRLISLYGPNRQNLWKHSYLRLSADSFVYMVMLLGSCIRVCFTKKGMGKLKPFISLSKSRQFCWHVSWCLEPAVG